MDKTFTELAESPWIPGRLLVKLRRSVPPADAFGFDLERNAIKTLEHTLQSLGAEGFEALFRPSSELDSAEPAGSFLGIDGPDSDRAHSYLVRYDPESMPLPIALQLLESRPEVAAACPDGYRYVFQQEGGPQNAADPPWASIAIDLARARSLGATGMGVKVAVLDTGVNSSLPSLAPQLVPGFDHVDLANTSPPINWKWAGDFKTADSLPDDDVGHGTQMAGLIGGSTVGVAPDCTLLPVRVLARLEHTTDGRVTGFGSISNVIKGIDWAVAQGASILNMSFGFPISTWAEREAVKRAFRRNCLLVAAVGNSGPNGELQFPAAFSEVLTVGAVGANLEVSAFSQRGDHLELVAPGDQVTVVGLDGSLQKGRGTSHATAIVSGVAALVRSVRPDLTVAQVIEVLGLSASRANRPGPFPSKDFGFGLVQAGAAVAKAKAWP